MSKISKALDKAKKEREIINVSPGIKHLHSEEDKLAKAYEKAASQREKSDSLLYGKSPFVKQGHSEIKPEYRNTKVESIPDRILERFRILTDFSPSQCKDSYDYFCTQVLQRTREKGWNSLMVSSSYPGEGKTLTAINLALSISREVHQTALLVEANFRNPKICTYFGLEEERSGLSDYLVNGSNLSELFFSPGVEKMVVLPTGKKVSSTKNFLGSPKMKDLVQELKNKYPDRYVIYDCPHVLEMPDTLIFSSYVDAVILVVEAGKTPGYDIANAVQTLKDRGVNIVGMILNKSS